MATVRELVTLFSFRESQGDSLGALDERVSKTKANIQALTVVIAAATGAVFGIAATTAAAADDFAKTSQQLGITAEELQELNFVAQLNGASLRDMQTAFRRMGKSANDAANRGLKASQEAYDRLGVSLTTVDGSLKPQIQLFEDVVGGLNALESETEKVALAQEIFGRSGAKLLPLINAGTEGLAAQRQEARDLGLVMSNEATQSAEQFNDEFLRLKSVFLGVRNEIGVFLIPLISEIFTETREWVQANRELIKVGLQEFFKALAAGLKFFVFLLRAAFSVTETLSRVFGGLGNVIEAATVALVAFASFQMLAAIGNMTLAFVAFVNTIRAATIAQWLFNAAMAFLPALLGLFIVLIGLIVDDLIRWSEGQDSLFGRIIEKGGPVGEALQKVGDAYTAIIDTVAELFTDISDFYDLVQEVGFIDAVEETFLGWIESTRNEIEQIVNLLDLFGVATRRAEAEAGLARSQRQLAAARAQAGIQGPQLVGGMIGGGAATPAVDARARQAQAQANRPVVRDINVGDINVTAPQSDPREQAAAMRREFDAALDEKLREADNDFAGGRT